MSNKTLKAIGEIIDTHGIKKKIISQPFDYEEQALEAINAKSLFKKYKGFETYTDGNFWYVVQVKVKSYKEYIGDKYVVSIPFETKAQAIKFFKSTYEEETSFGPEYAFDIREYNEKWYVVSSDGKEIRSSQFVKNTSEERA